MRIGGFTWLPLALLIALCLYAFIMTAHNTLYLGELDVYQEEKEEGIDSIEELETPEEETDLESDVPVFDSDTLLPDMQDIDNEEDI